MNDQELQEQAVRIMLTSTRWRWVIVVLTAAIRVIVFPWDLITGHARMLWRFRWYRWAFSDKHFELRRSKDGEHWFMCGMCCVQFNDRWKELGVDQEVIRCEGP